MARAARFLAGAGALTLYGAAVYWLTNAMFDLCAYVLEVIR